MRWESRPISTARTGHTSRKFTDEEFEREYKAIRRDLIAKHGTYMRIKADETEHPPRRSRSGVVY